jgi:hypothetical protein
MHALAQLLLLTMQLVALGAAQADAGSLGPQRGAAPTTPQSARPSRLCAWAPAPAGHARHLENTQRRSLAQVLQIEPRGIQVLSASKDWQQAGQVDDQVRRLLNARPRRLSPSIDWSEGAAFDRESFAAVISTGKGRPNRIEASGYQVCVSDSSGQVWYFRNVASDTWR